MIVIGLFLINLIYGAIMNNISFKNEASKYYESNLYKNLNINKIKSEGNITLSSRDVLKKDITNLKDEIKNGYLFGLNMLVDITFHHDIEISKYATSQLYSLYPSLFNDIKETISQYITSCYDENTKEDRDFFKHRPLLSAMAAEKDIASAVADNNNPFISDINNNLKEQLFTLILSSETESIIEKSRYITQTEISCWLEKLSEKIPFFYKSDNYENILRDVAVLDKKSEQVKNYAMLVNNNHWVSLFVYKNNIFLCDSLKLDSSSNPNDDRTLLKEKLKSHGYVISDFGGQLQENVPNGCGLFTLYHIDQVQKALMSDNEKKTQDLASVISQALLKAVNDFQKRDKNSQANFNQEFRKDLLMNMLYKIS